MIRNIIPVKCTQTDCLHFTKCCTVSSETATLGDSFPSVAFIGQGAGEDEEKTQRPFIGKAGKFLRATINYLWESGIKFNVMLTNTVRCRPLDQYGKNRDPLPEEINICIKHAITDIDSFKPKAIVLLGNSTCFNLTGTTQGISKIRGTQMTFHSIYAIPTYHPSYLCRAYNEFSSSLLDQPKVHEFINDIKLAVNLATQTTLF